MKAKYIGNCIGLSIKFLSPLIENAKEVTYKTVLHHVGKDQINTIFPFYQDCPGLHISNDLGVSFYSSRVNGNRYYYIQHSAIEYVFRKNN